MNKVLSTDQVTSFDEKGFINGIDVLTEDQAADYLVRLEHAEKKYPEAFNPENRNNPHLALNCFDELAHHPLILDAVEDLIGPNFGLYGSVLFIKEPQSSHYVSWHQDATYMGISEHRFVSPWIALTPSNRITGCMSMIPGSHKQEIRNHQDTFAEDNILTRGQVIQDIDEQSAIDLELKPGQMSIHHARVIHGSRPNEGTDRRVGFVLQAYVPAGARQTIGNNYWQPARGDFMQPDFVALKRPQHDMDSSAVNERQKANDNWANILYQGANKTRKY